MLARIDYDIVEGSEMAHLSLMTTLPDRTDRMAHLSLGKVTRRMALLSFREEAGALIHVAHLTLDQMSRSRSLSSRCRLSESAAHLLKGTKNVGFARFATSSRRLRIISLRLL